MVQHPTQLPGQCPGIIPPYLIDRLRQNSDDLPENPHRTEALPELTPDWQRCAELDTRIRTQRRREPQGLRVTLARPALAASPQRTICDAGGGTELPGPTTRTEGQGQTSDPAVNEAYAGLGATWELFFQEYQRDSLDDAGLPLLASVHYSQDYANAFWDGQQMVFGDGDGRIFKRLTKAIDVIGHELTHGLIQYSGGLDYYGQSGALNESLADVFGSLVKQRNLGQDAQDADWLIGAGLFTPSVQGVALRSLKAPGTAFDDPVLGRDPQPATMNDYQETESDNGGVHLNSGIPNHAFYLAAVAIPGPAWKTIGPVWYDTLISGLPADTSFDRFAAVTLGCAIQRYGADSALTAAIKSAWTEVGVAVEARTAVVLRRSGGILGLERHRKIDLTSLSAEEREPWLSSICAVQDAPDPDPRQRDRFIYRLTSPGGRAATAAEQNLPVDVRTFLDRSLPEPQ